MESVSGRWEFKMDKSKKKYAEFKLHVCFSKTKQVTIIIRLGTGVVLAKGPACIGWVNEEFTLLNDLVNAIDPNHVKLPDIGEHNDTTPPSNEPKVAPEDKEDNKNLSEVEILWEENTKLKNALKIIESELNANTENQLQQNSIYENTLHKLEEKVANIEKAYDNKSVVFCEEMQSSFNEELSNLKKSCFAKVGFRARS